MHSKSRLVPFTEGVLNAIIGLRIFFISKRHCKKKEARRECEQPLLSSQIINGSVTQNKSAGMEVRKKHTTRMRKLAEMGKYFLCEKRLEKGE
jgi:hypothetical protein